MAWGSGQQIAPVAASTTVHLEGEPLTIVWTLSRSHGQLAKQASAARPHGHSTTSPPRAGSYEPPNGAAVLSLPRQRTSPRKRWFPQP